MNTRTQSFGDEYLDWKDWQGAAFGQFDAALANYFAAETGIRDGRGVMLLEVGFGNGALLGWARSTGAEVFGVEVNPHLVMAARTLLGEAHAVEHLGARPLVERAGQFTHVLAIDVLEHIPQEALGPTLAQMAALLAPAGRIIARFPNGDSPFGRIHQHGDPTHVTTLGRAKLEYFARRAGLEIETLRAPALPRSGVGLRTAMRRAALLAGRAVVELVIGLLYFSGRRLPLDPNYVAVLRKRDEAVGA